MAALWPWVAVAAAGAFHGLNPANGWLFAVAAGGRAGDAARALRCLLPIGIGHVASIMLVAGAVAWGPSVDRAAWQAAALALLGIVVLLPRVLEHRTRPLHAPARFAGLALWSFVMSTAHGAGLMLVPALMPLCLGTSASAASPSTGAMAMTMALGAVGVHAASMLLAAAAVAAGFCRTIAHGKAHRLGDAV